MNSAVFFILSSNGHDVHDRVTYKYEAGDGGNTNTASPAFGIAGSATPDPWNWHGGSGGADGNWGSAGNGGGNPDADGAGTTGFNSVSAASAGGAAGKAISVHGNTVTWQGGNNSTQVKGPVS